MSAFHPHLLERRLRLTRTVVLGAGAALVLVFFRTQILDHSRYQLQSETNRLRPIPLPAPRGIITDRNGKILAENLTGYTVSLLPADDEDSLEATLRRMAPIVKLDGPAIERLLMRYRRTPYLPVSVLPNATFEIVSALEERRLIFPGLLIQPEPRRHYPDSSLVAHLVGYVGEITEAERAQRRFATVRLGGLLGKGGLERQYDDSLRGADGVRFVEVSAFNRVVREAAAGAGPGGAHHDRPRAAALHRPNLPGGTTRRGARAEPQFGRDPRPVQRAGLQSQRLRGRRGPGLLAPPQRERGTPAVRPHHPGALSAGIHLEAGPGRDGAAARRRHAAVAHADPVSRRLAVRQPLLPLLVGPRARRPRPLRRDRPELRRVLLPAGPEARSHVAARGRHRFGFPHAHRHRPPRREDR